MPSDDAAALLMTYGTTTTPSRTVRTPSRASPYCLCSVPPVASARAIAARHGHGLTVIAGASSQEKVDLCLPTVPTPGIVYPVSPRTARSRLSEEIKAAGGGGVDIVYGAVGGDYAEPAVRALNWEAALVVGPAIRPPAYNSPCWKS